MRASGLLVCLAGAAALWRPAFVPPRAAPRRPPAAPAAEAGAGSCPAAAAGGTRRRLLAGLLSGAAAAAVGARVAAAQERAERRPAVSISRPDGMRTASSGADKGYIDYVARSRIEASQWRETQAEALMHRAMLREAPTKEERVRRNQQALQRSAQLRQLLTASPAAS